jgi:hypothetical protein
VVDATEAATRARGLEVRPVDPPLRMPYGLIHRHRPLSDAANAFVAHAQQVAHAKEVAHAGSSANGPAEEPI